MEPPSAYPGLSIISVSMPQPLWQQLYKTSPLGFVRLVEQVAERSSGLDDFPRLCRAIATAGVEINPKPLLPLARSTSAKDQSAEVAKLVEAIKESRTTYAAVVVNSCP